MDLLEFLALECPLLLPAGREVVRKKLDPAAARELLLKALAPPEGEADRSIYPGTTIGQAASWGHDALREQIEGYFRREEIRSTLTPEERLEMYRVMVLSRTLDDLLKKLFINKEIRWEEYPSPQKGFRAYGQEAAAGLALRLNRGRENGDIVCPLIRGLPVLLMCVDDPLSVVLSQVGKKGTIFDGRDMHIGDLSRGVLPPTAPLAIGTQTLLGMAYAAKLRKENRVFLSIMGEGGTSMGEWHEAINFAAVQRLAMIFAVENNHWALGTHWREQTAAPRFALKAAGYGIPGITIFGNDADEVAAASAWAAERARAGKGPSLIELVTYRRGGHAHHDDDRFQGGPNLKGYEYEEERKLWEAADPIPLYEKRLLSEGVLDEQRIARILEEARRRVSEAEKAAEAAPWPVFADMVNRCYAPRTEPPPPVAPSERKLMSYDGAIRQGMIEAMERDPRVIILGEDVGGRYGGAFGVTRGLAKKFGPERCLNTVLAESAIIGCGIGAALAGMRPIVEMQFADFLACGFNALVNNAAKTHWRWGRAVPLVLRLPYGGATPDGKKLLGGGPFHSQCPEAWLLRAPGWKIVAPATSTDAKGLLTAALRDNNPVVFLESKGLYGFVWNDSSEQVPLGDFEVPIGKAEVRRLGRDLTILTYGVMVWVALAAAEELAKGGVEAEVIDLRSLVPLDEETVLASVARTHRALILHEDSRRGGVGAELSALIAEEVLWELDAPILRVAAPDFPVPYSPPLEKAYLPGPKDVVEAARRLVER